MVSLVDIVPQTRTVQIAAGVLELRGVKLRQVADLFLHYPNLRNFFVEGAPEITPEELLIQMPDMVGEIISECAVQPDGVDAVTYKMSLDEVLDCLEVISELSFSRGLTPFLIRLNRLINGAAAGPIGRGQAMSAPQQSKSLSPQDMIAAE